MKKNSKTLLATLSILLLTGCANQMRSNQSDKDFVSYNSLFKQANNSNDKMKTMSLNNNPDYNFALLMIEHHKGEIDISKSQLSSGHHVEMKNIAENIINNEGDEILKLKYIVDNYKLSENKPNENFNKSMTDIMKGASHDLTNSRRMINTVCKIGMEMGVNYKLRGKSAYPAETYENYKCDMGIDYGFGVIMSIHHQEAIDMSKSAMNYLKDPELKTMALKIIDEHQAELNSLDNWLDNNVSSKKVIKSK